jgi:hypothetical protein
LTPARLEVGEHRHVGPRGAAAEQHDEDDRREPKTGDDEQ